MLKMSKNNEEITTPTGLPELPEGYYWRVFKDKYHDGDYFVAVMRQKTYLWLKIIPRTVEERVMYSRMVDDRGLGIYGGALSKKNIISTCNYLVRRMEETLQRQKAEEEFLGDYPPKSLL